MEFLQNLGLLDVFASAFLVVLGILGRFLFPLVKDSLKSLKNETDSNVVVWLAEEATELMEERLKGENGYEKFERATSWLAERTEERDINISEEEIRGAIQKGYNLTVGEKKQKEDGNDGEG